MNPNVADKPLVWIVWRNHYTTTDWTEPKELEKQEADLNDSVGWLMFEDDDRLTLAMTVSRETHSMVRGTLTIEKSCISGRRNL